MIADALTPYEYQVVRSIVGGRSNEEAAQHLGLSLGAVRARRAAAMKKLGARTIVDLVRMVAAEGKAASLGHSPPSSDVLLLDGAVPARYGR